MFLVDNIRYRHTNEKKIQWSVSILSINEKQIAEIIATFFVFFSLFIYLIIYRSNFNFNFEEDDFGSLNWAINFFSNNYLLQPFHNF